MKPEALAALHHLAKIRADLELKRFSALRQHVTVLTAQKDRLERDLAACYNTNAPLDLSQARLAAAMARQTTRHLSATEDEIARLRPRFEQVRAQASRAFGRAEVLADLEKIARAARAARKK